MEGEFSSTFYYIIYYTHYIFLFVSLERCFIKTLVERIVELSTSFKSRNWKRKVQYLANV